MTAIDTSALVHSICGEKLSAVVLRRAVERGERLFLPSVVLFEWLRGPRVAAELISQEILFPSAAAAVFGPREAELAAKLYRSVARPHGREIDIAIAATAILRDAELWTLNPVDFADIPGVRLASF